MCELNKEIEARCCPNCRLDTVKNGICEVCDWGSAYITGIDSDAAWERSSYEVDEE